mmetsp:Transcript_149072/g.415468  ORF Transcript_149072/g.415468 Transcript_149072/m.415468 type:complete len:247 (+) Transcript_149072:39-779(+)
MRNDSHAATLQRDPRALRGLLAGLALGGVASLAWHFGAAARSALVASACPSAQADWSPVACRAGRRGRAGNAAATRWAARVLEPPAPPSQLEEELSRESTFVECDISAAYRRGRPCGSDNCGAEGAEWRASNEAWLFREVYMPDFEVLLRKLGYHLPMIYQNVTITCEEKTLRAMLKEKCADCIRHLTSDAYGELGMLIPAHPDRSMRGHRDAPLLEAFHCLTQGKAYGPSAALFCRTKQDAATMA